MQLIRIFLVPSVCAQCCACDATVTDVLTFSITMLAESANNLNRSCVIEYIPI